MSCKKPYSPNVINSTNSFLVVEGYININDTTVVKLSRTVNIYSKTSTKPVLHAIVTTENDENRSFPLTEVSNGKYKLGGVLLDTSHKYRFRIKTSDNKEYLSDFVQPRVAPLIDSVGYTLVRDGVQFYVNTHNSKNDTRYYRWDYGETWIIHSRYISLFKAISSPRKGIVNRRLSEEISRCWASDTSSSITIGSSEKLTQNVIANLSIILVPLSSEKFTERYSLLVNQYALNKDAYVYYQKLKKNTEQLGSIFDAEPSQLTGNIHCVTNSDEPVIGFISAGSVSHKRIFVDPEKLPHAILETPYNSCSLDSLLFTDSYFTKFYYSDEIPVNAIVDPIIQKDTLGFTGSTSACVDCTLRGTNKQPGFWQ
jgi:hypothetical protein